MAPHRVLFGEHRWRNLAYLLLAILIGYLALGAYAIYLGRELGEANGRLDSQATAENLAEAGQCYGRARSRPNTDTFLDLLGFVVDDIRITTEDALAQAPDAKLTHLRKERLGRVEDFEETLRLYRKGLDESVPSLEECDKIAMGLGLTKEQVKDLRSAGAEQ
jgi:hypothetical protein